MEQKLEPYTSGNTDLHTRRQAVEERRGDKLNTWKQKRHRLIGWLEISEKQEKITGFYDNL